MRTLIGIFLCATLLTGCIPKDYIEELGIITAIAYDQIDDQKLRGTMVIYQFDPTTTRNSQIITSVGNTSKGVRYEADRLTSHKLVSGQVRLGIFGKELASKGLMKYMDTLSRDAKISDLGHLAISENQASDLLDTENSEDTPNTGTYIQKLLEKSVNNEIIPNSMMRSFMHNYYDVGIDPVLPILTREDEKTVVRGLALFQHDRMVARLPDDDVFYLLLLKKDMENGQVQMQLPQDSLNEFHKSTSIEPKDEGPLHISIHEIDSDIHYEPKPGNPTKHTIHVKLEAQLIEITKEIDLKSKKAIKTLEKVIESKIKKRSQQVMAKLKDHHVDPVGLGKEYNERNRKHRITKENWHNQIPNLDVTFNVQLELLGHGITE